LAKFFRRFNFGFLSCQSFWRAISFANLKLSVFHIDLPGSGRTAAWLSCAQIREIAVGQFLRQNGQRLTVNDAYYFGNVDKMSTSAAGVRAPITQPKTAPLTQNIFIFTGFHCSRREV